MVLLLGKQRNTLDLSVALYGKAKPQEKSK
jgi:hypothetical protein